MFEITDSTTETRFIDFGSNGKVLFQLPVLGDDGVPMGIMSAFGIFWDKFQQGRSLSEQEVASSWSFFIQTLADAYPDATRKLARLDKNQLGDVLKHWVQKSEEIANFDPKAP